MKKFKLTVVVALIIAMCVSMTACGLSKEDVVGTWSGGYVHEGSTYGVAFILNSDGSYTKAVYKDNGMDSIDIGTYTVKGKKVTLDSNYNAGTITYKYKGGALVNNGHEFTKK